ncbi:Vacuolar protein sorting-associated protein 37B [Bagarius yarrelli]|uniref:Vacuolar protein sorting-associated protein 37B n=1 Tax=Bagarius yarrelli TaxID=175774 RepID=A0A556U349_BAGYA|nr:Vacuolar protein sorting-associated protein 37B [Bagarius yarrelli]
MGEMFGLTSKFSSYSLTQLNELLEDDDKLIQIVKEMDEMQEMQQTKEMTLVSNRSLAEQNLNLQPSLEQRKMQLIKSYCFLQELYEAYQLHKCTIDHNSGKSSLDTLLALLQAEGAKIEEETENMADSFLNGDLSLDIFIETYQANRKLAHLRRVKIDKLQEMVLKCFQMPQATTEHVQSQFPPLSEPFDGQGNSSLDPMNASYSTSIQLTGQQAALPYPETPYPPVQMPSMGPPYTDPLTQSYTPAFPQRPPPRTGFIIQ